MGVCCMSKGEGGGGGGGAMGEGGAMRVADLRVRRYDASNRGDVLPRQLV